MYFLLVQTDNKPTISDGTMKVVGGGGNWNNAYMAVWVCKEVNGITSTK